MKTPAHFTWTDRYLLGHGKIDETHREFVECVDALLTASDSEVPDALDAFIRHADTHFGQEDEWLSSDDFPGGGECHVAEHEKVLQAAHEVRHLVRGGNFEVARAYGQALADWFPGHADYMDSALAAWLVRRTHNARPLVFRRMEAA